MNFVLPDRFCFKMSVLIPVGGYMMNKRIPYYCCILDPQNFRLRLSHIPCIQMPSKKPAAESPASKKATAPKKSAPKKAAPKKSAPQKAVAPKEAAAPKKAPAKKEQAPAAKVAQLLLQ